MKSQGDKHRSDTPIYQPGDQVWLSTDNLCLPWKSKKLSERWIRPYLLRFSSWAVPFSLFLLFMPHLPSWGPFLTPIITIFLSWDLSHSPYVPSNPYTIPCIIAGQGIFFASLFLVMDAYSSSQFSRISYVLLLFIFPSLIFHDFLLLLSRTFYLVLWYSFAYSADLFLSI